MELEAVERDHARAKKESKKSEEELKAINRSIHTVAEKDPGLVAPQVLQTVPKPEPEKPRTCAVL